MGESRTSPQTVSQAHRPARRTSTYQTACSRMIGEVSVRLKSPADTGVKIHTEGKFKEASGQLQR